MLYQLPAELYERFDEHLGNGQSALLTLVRSSIQNTYPTSKIGGDGQVVVIAFNDAIKFEILPAFLNKGGGYTFADSNGGGAWKTCQPKQEIEAFTSRDKACNGNLVQLARMARAWKDQNNVLISGMLIDTLAYQFIGTWVYRE